jgi:uncharacterized membrane protein
MRTLQNVTLLGATIAAGLMAGLFFAFAASVMPALRGADDRAFVDVMQRINAAIINPVFMTVFMGGLAVTAAAAIAYWRNDGGGALPWIVAGLVLYVAMFLVTIAINVPLNNTLDAAGDVARISDVGAVRHHFEGPWVAWNIVRAVLNVAAFACLAVALFVHDRTPVADTGRALPAPTVVVAERQPIASG